jgi:DNA-binding GntR family transcriptional regulator
VREAIECALVRRASIAFHPGMRERIGDLLGLQAAAASRGERAAFRGYDDMFHQALASGAACSVAWDAIRDMKAHVDRLSHLMLPDAATMAPIVEQYRAIMAAIDAKDADAAEAALRDHLGRQLLALPRVEAEYSRYFIAQGAS